MERVWQFEQGRSPVHCYKPGSKYQSVHMQRGDTEDGVSLMTIGDEHDLPEGGSCYRNYSDGLFGAYRTGQPACWKNVAGCQSASDRGVCPRPTSEDASITSAAAQKRNAEKFWGGVWVMFLIVNKGRRVYCNDPCRSWQYVVPCGQPGPLAVAGQRLAVLGYINATCCAAFPFAYLLVHTDCWNLADAAYCTAAFVQADRYGGQYNPCLFPRVRPYI